MLTKEQNKIESHNNNENVSGTQLLAESCKEFPLNAMEMGTTFRNKMCVKKKKKKKCVDLSFEITVEFKGQNVSWAFDPPSPSSPRVVSSTEKNMHR